MTGTRCAPADKVLTAKLTLGSFDQFRSGFDVTSEEFYALSLLAVDANDEGISPLGGSAYVDRASRDFMRTTLAVDLGHCYLQ